ncbi:MAG: ACP S-malonyltransferase [Vulcanimicrobiaceae bacterium]
MNAQRIGVVFPGQGSQVIGMGQDVAAGNRRAAQLFSTASEILGYDLLELVRNAPQERLRQTQFSQPAIFATNIALYFAVGQTLRPVVSAGHSFGEFCSLTISGAVSFEDALTMVDARGKAMQLAAERTPGGMSAVLGMEASAILEVVNDVRGKTGARVALANFNAPMQTVISGDLLGVRAAGDALLAAGAKRVVPLNVSGAWHSELMEPAVAAFSRAVEAAQVSLPQFDVISNLDARPYRDVATIRKHLIASITSEVRWHDTSLALLEYGLDSLVEFGASPVLAPLAKRLPGVPPVHTVSDLAGVERFEQTLEPLVGRPA